ncbi:MAG: substrate-binding domain-containing protein [Chloroflexi bacterium]|nr:substrate-binding domain-containing protein [Chloroflexota bacterium]
MTDSSARTRLTIGVILDNVAGDSRSSLWPGIADTIQAQGGDLLCFTGGYLDDPLDFSKRGNVVYDMIDKTGLDGLIIWTSSLFSYVGLESVELFCARYRPLPMVSIGVVVNGIPSVLLDSYQGMREALIHLITIHGRRRLVFIRGPEGHRDAQERYRAYLDVLKEYGLPFIPELVSPPNKWFSSGGAAMMHTLLDQHHTSFDAVVGVNDNLAVEAMEILHARGIRVPEDVSVVGFDNTPLSRVVTPLLTTVPWRMYERGRQAAKLMLSMLAGEPVPDQVLLPTHLVVRQSCGCQDPAVMQARGKSPSFEQTTMMTPGNVTREQCLAILEQTIEEKERLPESLAQFLDAFWDELEGKAPDIFLPTLERILRQVVTLGGDISVWQMAVSALRHQLLPTLLNDQPTLMRAEDLWHQARVMIGERSRRTRAYQEWLARQQTIRLRRINHGLATMTSVPELMNVLAEELPHLGIASCYLALYEDPANPTEWCRLVLAFDENGRRDLGLGGRRVQSRQLAMGNDLLINKPRHMLIAPLYFQDEQLGLIMFAQRPIGDLYEVLRDEISTTLKGVMLAEQNARLYRQALEAQQAAQEGRHLAEQADRLKSSFLSMVSHELMTPLVLLVGLSEMMLREGSSNRPPLPEPYRSDLARIHLSAQHLGNLVRDVLDLTRSQMGQLKLTKEPLNLGETLKTVALVGEQMARDKGLAWQIEMPERLPMVYGDPSRLQQVALNLVANAVKFTTHGWVKLQVAVHDATITVRVSDTGLGVPKSEQEAIFDEFRQSERTVARGYGGLGIGLAICRQLVELHGGQIGVHSSGDENGGSAFYFTLPVMREPSPERALPKANPDAVLLLNERAASGTRLQEYLAREGFQVRRLDIDANPDWLAQVLAQLPGAVVLDYEPASDRGWQLIEMLKDNPVTQDIPVLFYSLQEPDTGAMLTLDYLSKPMGTAALARALQRYGLRVNQRDEKSVILVVDDDPSILEMHTRIVRTFLPDCRVLEAANGRIALEIMRQEMPALVLLDLMMPELDGMGVLAEMQENEKSRGIPVIVLTAQALTLKEMAQLNRGVAAVLQKGLFTAEETLEHIKQTLARNKRLGSETRRMVGRVMAFIHEHYAESISRDDMASYVGVSARHLTRCFHLEMGISPITYLNRFRVKKAKQLLEAGDQNITQVAEAVGFSSSNYFTDAFRREIGMSPRDYQRRQNAALR